MFVLTAKLSKKKLIAAGVIVLAAIVLIVLLATSGSGGKGGKDAPIGNTNDDRVAYLATFGWSVNAEPTETQKVKIPDTTDNKVFARYNDLQKSQGFDLTEFTGKEVMRYVYEILNYPNASDPVYASILVYDGQIIGGDITDTAPDGVIHGFSKPSGNASATEGTEGGNSASSSAAESGTVESSSVESGTETTAEAAEPSSVKE